MKVITILGLFLMLVACMSQTQSTPSPLAATTTPTPAAQTTSAAFASSALLMLRKAVEDTSYFPQPPSAQRYRDETHLVDPATGQDLPDHPPLGVRVSAISSDGTRAAGIESRGQSCEASGGGSACYASADVLHLIDLTAWRAVTTTLSANDWAGPLVFSPDSTRLALSLQERRASTLMLLDARTGAVLIRRALSFLPTQIKYTQDGTQLILYGQPFGNDPGMTKPDPPRVLALNGATLDVQWEQSLTNIVSGSWCLESCQSSHEQQLFASWTPAVVAAHDGRALYIVHADAERLTTVDFDAHTVRMVEIRAAQSWLERLLDFGTSVAEAKGGFNGAHKSAVLSPDDAMLYVLTQTEQATRNALGDWDTQYASLGVQVIETSSGRRMTRHDDTAKAIKMTLDGAHLLLHDWDGRQWWTDVLDAKSLQRVARLDDWEVVIARRLDGQPILLAQNPYHPALKALLDPRTFAVVHSWTASSYASWVSPP